MDEIMTLEIQVFASLSKEGRFCYSMAKEYCNPNTYNSLELWNYLVENGFVKDEESK